LLRGDHASRAAYYVSALQNGWMTINEVRQLENLNPIGEEGDLHFVPMNMQTLEQMAEEPEPPPMLEPPEDQPVDDPPDEPPADEPDDTPEETETDGRAD
jgi:hypothetical protein